MKPAEMIMQLQSDEKMLIKQAFDKYYGSLKPISIRYSKNLEQAESLMQYAFYQSLSVLKASLKNQEQANIEHDFIRNSIAYIKSIRSEYYVASTVYAANDNHKPYNLFDNNELIDFKNLKEETILSALQKLVPSQRLVFNLIIIDGLSIEKAAEFLEASLDATKSNLEKARYNFQKNVENCVRTSKA